MNKALLRIIYLVLMLTSGLAFSLGVSSPSRGIAQADSAGVITDGANRSLASGQAAPLQPLTPTPTPQPTSHPGSTDGIVIMSLTIVVIILLPILLQRSLWKK